MFGISLPLGPSRQDFVREVPQHRDDDASRHRVRVPLRSIERAGHRAQQCRLAVRVLLRRHA